MRKNLILLSVLSFVLFIFPFAYAQLFTEYQTVSREYFWNFEHFTINSDSYLAAPNIDGKSKIYKWDGQKFTEFQTIFIYCSYDLEPITIGSDIYLAAASVDNGIDSKIYRWDGVKFKEFQTIPTNGAYDWEAFTIGEDIYLALAGADNLKIYRWTATHFTEFQIIPFTDIDVFYCEFFGIDSDSYLVVANLDSDAQIYRWVDNQFIPFQTIPINYGYDWESFTIGSDIYLAVACGNHDSNAIIYKWDGAKFTEFQTIQTSHTYDFESFQIGSDIYLAMANDSNDADINSQIYKWNGSKFIEFQTIQSAISRGMESFIIDSDLYLAVSDLELSKIYKANIEKPNINGIILDPLIGDAPLSVDFSAILIGGTSPYTYSWDFDGDGVEDSSLESPLYTYNIAGTYNITVTITDADSKVATQNASIVVTQSDPTTNLTIEDCFATYDFINNQFIVPCYELNGILYKVNMTLNSDDPYFLFKLDDIFPQ